MCLQIVVMMSCLFSFSVNKVYGEDRNGCPEKILLELIKRDVSYQKENGGIYEKDDISFFANGTKLRFSCQNSTAFQINPDDGFERTCYNGNWIFERVIQKKDPPNCVPRPPDGCKLPEFDSKNLVLKIDGEEISNHNDQERNRTFARNTKAFYRCLDSRNETQSKLIIERGGLRWAEITCQNFHGSKTLNWNETDLSCHPSIVSTTASRQTLVTPDSTTFDADAGDLINQKNNNNGSSFKKRIFYFVLIGVCCFLALILLICLLIFRRRLNGTKNLLNEYTDCSPPTPKSTIDDKVAFRDLIVAQTGESRQHFEEENLTYENIIPICINPEPIYMEVETGSRQKDVRHSNNHHGDSDEKTVYAEIHQDPSHLYAKVTRKKTKPPPQEG